MKQCKQCKRQLNESCYSPGRAMRDGLRARCKKCRTANSKTRSRTPRGKLIRMYNHQKESSKQHGHPPPAYTFDEFSTWAYANGYQELYDIWLASDCSKLMSPSGDRLDPNKPYTLDNLRMVTWDVNNVAGWDIMRRPIIQYDMDGNVIAQYTCASDVERKTGIGNKLIQRVCSGKRKTTHGYKWEYKEDTTMMELTNTKMNTISAVLLWQHLNEKLGQRDYDTYWSELCTLLQWYVDNQVDGFHTFSYNTYESNGHVTMDLTEAMVRVYVNSLRQCTNELVLDVSYLFNGIASVQYLQGLHNQYSKPVESIKLNGAESPTFSDGRAGMSSLRIAEIASVAKDTDVRHADILRACSRLNSAQRPSALSDFCSELVEDKYLDSTNRACKFYWLSYDLALLVAGTYSPDIQRAVIAEMNRLRSIVNDVTHLPTVPVIDISQPVIAPLPQLPQQYYTVTDAITRFGGEYDRQALENACLHHHTPHIDVSDNTNVVPSYSVLIWQCVYNIQPTAWIVII